jgi:hypothetical protein
MHRSGPVQVKGQSGKQRTRQRCHILSYPKALDVPKMQQTKHSKQKQQQRSDAREADAIKLRRLHLSQRSEAPQRRQRNQKSRHREEDSNPVVPISKEKMSKLPSHHLVHGRAGKMHPYPRMQQDHRQYRKPAQHVDAIKPRRHRLLLLAHPHRDRSYSISRIRML